MSYIKKGEDLYKRPKRRPKKELVDKSVPSIFIFKEQLKGFKLKQYVYEKNDDLGGYFFFPRNKKERETLSALIVPQPRRRNPFDFNLDSIRYVPSQSLRELYVDSGTSESN